ncbi:hypothetical protein Pcinc_032743, partial [Petrolisthes cinctipes]
EPLPSPVIEGSRGEYRVGDEVRLRCVVGGRLPHYSPHPTLTWIIDGSTVRREHVREEPGREAVSLLVPASQLWRKNNNNI